MSPQSADIAPIAPLDVPAPADVAAPQPKAPNGSNGGRPQAAPSAFGHNDFGPGPSVAVVHYDPQTGGYVAPDGHLYKQSNLVTRSKPKTWKDMLSA
jgi:phospholipid/cholesterol/gamma-HCH transport system substrate-binding protein